MKILERKISPEFSPSGNHWAERISTFGKEMIPFRKIKSFLCDPGAEASKDWHHETLGHTSWAEDEEAWVGNYNNIRFLLGYERDSASPPSAVVDYALEILSTDFDFVARFEGLKQQSISINPERFHQEIGQLKIESAHFYRGKNCCQAVARLSGGEDFRAWRFDMLDTQLSNLAFDS